MLPLFVAIETYLLSNRGSLDRLDLYLPKSVITFLCFTPTQVKYICVAELFIIILHVFKLVEMCFKL